MRPMKAAELGSMNWVSKPPEVPTKHGQLGCACVRRHFPGQESSFRALADHQPTSKEAGNLFFFRVS